MLISSLLFSDIILRIPGKKFTLPTTYKIGIQALDAIRLFHEAGFIHRDIKPVCPSTHSDFLLFFLIFRLFQSNFLIGRTQMTLNTIYLIDFGLMKRYVFNDGSRIPV